jgi:hypothetical protein
VVCNAQLYSVRGDRTSCGMRMPRFLPQSSATGFDLGARRARASKGTRANRIPRYRIDTTFIDLLSFSSLLVDLTYIRV